MSRWFFPSFVVRFGITVVAAIAATLLGAANHWPDYIGAVVVLVTYTVVSLAYFKFAPEDWQ